MYFHFLFITTILIFYWKNLKDFASNSKRVRQYNLLSNSLLWLAIIILIYAFISKDYSYITVYENSDNSMSFFDRFMATWASRPGAMMLWAAIQSLITVFAVNLFEEENKSRLEKNIVTILLFFNVLIAMFSLSTRPGAFSTQVATNDGLGLTPSLLNFWQQIHPPVAFFSYSAFIVPYAISIAGLLKKSDEVVSEKIHWIMDFYMMIGWLLTTIFILAGSIWAYEVDWGGLWIWDPVQVSSFILWIMASVYFHLKPLVSKDSPVHLFSAGLGWVGVTFAAFVVRGGLIEGPHQYIGRAQLIVFSLLLLGTALGLGIAYIKHEGEVIPEWMFSLKNTKNKFSLMTIWLLGITIVTNITSISLNIIYAQLSIPTRDLSEFYGILNGIILTVLAILVILCESETLGIQRNRFNQLFIGGLLVSFTYFFFVVPVFRTFSFILLTVMGAAVLVQLGSIIYVFAAKKGMRRIMVRFIHFIILLTLLAYFATDPHSIEEEYLVADFERTSIDGLNIFAQIDEIRNGTEIQVLLSIYDDNNDFVESLTLHQGLYRGAPWIKGDWITFPTKDIFVRLSDVDNRLFFDQPSILRLLFKEIPSLNLFRANLALISILAVFSIWGRLKSRKMIQIKNSE